MKRTLLFLALGLGSLVASAQIPNIVKQKAAQAIKTKASKGDTTTTNTNTNTNTNNTNGNSGNPFGTGTDTTAKQTGTTTTTTNTSTPQGGMFGFSGGSAKDIKSEYVFTDNMKVEITNYKKDGKVDGDPVQVRYMFSSEKVVGMETSTTDSKSKKTTTTKSVVDVEKKQMIMLTEDEGNKTGMVIKYNPEKWADKNEKDSTKAPKFVKTGRTKVILGYTCEEWVSTDEKGNKTEVWMAPNLTLDIAGAQQMFAGQMKMDAPSGDFPKGTMLEMTNYEKNGEKTTFRVLEINLKQTTSIKTSDYTFMGF